MSATVPANIRNRWRFLRKVTGINWFQNLPFVDLSENVRLTIFGALAKLRKATVSLVMYVLTVRLREAARLPLNGFS
jgi:hypothetical protein